MATQHFLWSGNNKKRCGVWAATLVRKFYWQPAVVIGDVLESIYQRASLPLQSGSHKLIPQVAWRGDASLCCASFRLCLGQPK